MRTRAIKTKGMVRSFQAEKEITWNRARPSDRARPCMNLLCVILYLGFRGILLDGINYSKAILFLVIALA